MDPFLLQIIEGVDSTQQHFDQLKSDIFAYIHSTAVPPTAVPVQPQLTYSAPMVIDIPPVAKIDQATTTTSSLEFDANSGCTSSTLDHSTEMNEQVAGNDQSIREQQPEQHADMMNQTSTSTGHKRKSAQSDDDGGVKKRATTVQADASNRKYVCATVGCERSFKWDIDLARHERVHLDTKPFVCTWPNCGKSARERSQLVKHIRTIHFKLPPTIKRQEELNMVDERNPNEYIQVDSAQLNRHHS